jgi:hypothetical protein
MALELRWWPLRGASRSTMGRVRVRASSGDQRVEEQHEFEPARRWTLPLPERLPAAGQPIEVDVQVLPGSTSFVLDEPGLVVRGPPAATVSVAGALVAGWVLALIVPVALAVVLGLVMRGVLAFLIAALFGTAAYCAPFFRDAARYVDIAAAEGAHSTAKALLGRLARRVLLGVPDLSPLAPRTLLDDLRASGWASELWPWLVVMLAATWLAARALRAGEEDSCERV